MKMENIEIKMNEILNDRLYRVHCRMDFFPLVHQIDSSQTFWSQHLSLQKKWENSSKIAMPTHYNTVVTITIIFVISFIKVREKIYEPGCLGTDFCSRWKL